MSESGSPWTAIKSAYLPGSIDPTLSCHPMSSAAPIVAARIASIGIRPSFAIAMISCTFCPWLSALKASKPFAMLMPSFVR